MKTRLHFIAMLLATSLAGGCASGGGGGGSVPISHETPPPNAQQQASAAYSPCGTINGHPVTCVPLRPEFPETTTTHPLTCPVFGGCAGNEPVPAEPTYSTLRTDLRYESASMTGQVFSTTPSSPPGRDSGQWLDYQLSLAAIDEPELAGRFGRGSDANPSPPANPFHELGIGSLSLGPAGSAGMSTGPDWNYQSFGIWNENVSSSYGLGWMTAWSRGAETDARNIPQVGTATFNGKLAGLYVDPNGQGSIAIAKLSLEANFASRSLALASTETRLTRNGTSSIGAPNLDLHGNFSYAAGSNTFSGSLTNVGATISGASKGRFYGPSAPEAGGVFALKSDSTLETFVGGFGAKR